MVGKHTEEDETGYAEQSSNHIGPLQHLAPSQSVGVHARRGEVEANGHDEADKVPEGGEEADVAPRRVGGDELGVEGAQAEGGDGEDEDADVLAALGDGGHLGGSGQGGELVDAGADAGEDLAADDDVHLLGGRDDDHAEDDEQGARDGDVAAPEEVREGADEGAHGAQGEDVGQRDPRPAVGAANVGVDVRRDGAEEVDGDLGPRPEEAQGGKGQQLSGG